MFSRLCVSLVLASLVAVPTQSQPCPDTSLLISWSDFDGNVEVSTVIVDQANHNHVLIGSEAGWGVWESFDGGQSWRPFSYDSSLTRVARLEQSKSAPHVVYGFRQWPNGGLFSLNLPEGIYSYTGGCYADFGVSFTDYNTVYCGYEGGGRLSTFAYHVETAMLSWLSEL